MPSKFGLRFMVVVVEVLSCLQRHLFASSQAAPSSTPLNVLALVPFTGYEPADGKACQAAMDVVVDAVNADSSVLGDYTIQVSYRDEGQLGTKSPGSLMRFLEANNGDQLAPVIVGSYYICQTISRIVRQFDMVQFSTWCAGSIFTGDRKTFPNLYRQVTPQENNYIPQLYLAKYIGKWKQVGIVYSPINISEFIVAKFLYQMLEAEGIATVWFDAVVSLDTAEIMDSLKASDARIIYISFYESSRLLAFLCLAYRESVHGPRYQFVAYSDAYTDPSDKRNVYPNGCTRETLKEMYKITIFVGNFEGLISPTLYKNTSLGYGTTEFEKRLALKLDSPRPPDYGRRFFCHDAMLHALLSLHHAEKALLQNYNLTIRNFADHPEIVMNAVNYSAAYIPFEGLEHRLMYSQDRLEMDRRFLTIAQFDPTDGELHVKTRMYHTGNTSKTLRNLSNFYEIVEVGKPVWYTNDGGPTKDLSKLIHIVLEFPMGWVGFAFIVVISIISIVLSFILLCFIFATVPVYNVSDTSTVNTGLLVGGILANAAAITFACPLNLFSCNFQIVLTILGISIAGSCLSGKLLLMVLFCKEKGKVPSPFPVSQSRRPPGTVGTGSLRTNGSLSTNGPSLAATFSLPSINIPKEQLMMFVSNHVKRYVKSVTSIVFTFIFVNIVLIVGFVAHENVTAINVVAKPIFDGTLDRYSDVTTIYCYSPNLFAWKISFAVINLLPLLFAVYLAYRLRNVDIVFLKQESNFLRITAINSIAIYLFVIVASLITHELVNIIILSLGLWLFGNSTALFPIWPLFRARLSANNVKPS